MKPKYRPLQWPEDWQRTAAPIKSPWWVEFGSALDDTINALERIQAKSVVITLPFSQSVLQDIATSWNPEACALRAGCYGNFAAHDRKVYGINPSGPYGVAIYFKQGKEQRVFACDQWMGVTDNLRAIGLTLKALWTIERAGITQLTERVYKGFTALGSAATEAEPWNAVLGVDEDASAEEIKSAYRAKARVAHPDLGGSHEAMVTIKNAYEEGMRKAG